MRVLLVTLAAFLTACSARPAVAPSSITPADSTIDFGAVAVGVSAARDVRIAVHGTNLPRIDDATVPAGFTAGLWSNVVRVTFAPEQPGSFSADILVHAGSATARVHVRGTAYAWSVQAQPADLDFGTVMVGAQLTLPVQVLNSMQVATDVFLNSDAAAFWAEPNTLHLEPGASRSVNVRFAPMAKGRIATQLHLAPCDVCKGAVVNVSGTAGVESFVFDPSPLDFGGRLVGTTTCRDVAIRNDGNVPIRFNSASPDAASLKEGVFELRLGGLLDGTTSIAPGTSAAITICFEPGTQGMAYAGRISFQTVTNAFSSLQITGRGGGPGLETDPADVDLGVTPPGTRVTRDVLLENTGEPGSLVLQSVRLERADIGLHLVIPDGIDLVGRDVGTTPLRIQVAMDGNSGEHAGTLIVEASDGEVLDVPVHGIVVDGPGCDLAVPAELRAGFVHPGENVIKLLPIHNRSSTDACYVWGFGVDPAISGDHLLDAPGGLSSIGPGATLGVSVVFVAGATTTSVHFWKLAVEGKGELVRIPLAGFASQLDLTVSPNPIDFGTVPVGFLTQVPVTLTNNGTRPLKIGGSDIAGSATEFTLSGPTRWPQTLPAGGSLTVMVAFRAAGAGPYQAELEFWLPNTPEPIIVPVTATAVDPACTDHCIDFEAMCPAAATTYVGLPVELDGQTYESHEPSTITCQWEVTGFPPGSHAALQIPGGCKARLKPDLAGDYTVQLTAVDDAGRTSSCQTQVSAANYSGLSIQTTWDSPDDLDLHLFHAFAGDPSNAGAWFKLPYDCYYENDHPHWDTASREDDPQIATDDQVGRGPEIIELPVPGSGESYGVGVHWFGDTHGTATETATTRISCAGTVVAEVQTVLTRLHMAADIGTVTWNGDGTCSFTPNGATLIVVP